MFISPRDRTRPPRTMDIFDEKLHPLTVGHVPHSCVMSSVLLQRDEVPSHYGDFTPDNKIIYRFIKTLFHAAQVILYILTSDHVILFFSLHQNVESSHW